MSTFYYLAYGSNLHPVRLRRRCPSAIPIGVVKLDGVQLTFHKKSKKDGSGKCNIFESSGHTTYGVIYEISFADKRTLDKEEGKGNGYRECQFKIPFEDKIYLTITYVAESNSIEPTLQPNHWYKSFVVEGARHHAMPDEYIAMLESVASIPDLDTSRVQENQAILEEMRLFDRAIDGN